MRSPRQKRPAVLVTGCIKVCFSKHISQVSAPQVDHVHHRKGHIGYRIGIAKTFIELNAIDDDKVVAGVQHLPEVIVAVGTDAKTCDAAGQNAPDTLLNFLLATQ